MEQGKMYGQVPTAGEALVDLVAALVGAFLQRAVMAPPYRITVLTALEGELVREGRLPKTGFGGIFGCVRRTYTKEGVLSFFRGLLTDAVLAAPSAVAENISSSLVSWLIDELVPVSIVQGMPGWVYITVSLTSTSAAVLLAAPVTAIHSTIVTNYMGDIVASSPSTASSSSAHPLGAAAAPEVEEMKEEDKKEEDKSKEAYKYASATQTAKDIRRRWGFRGFYRGVGMEVMAVFLYRGTYYYALQLLSSEIQDKHPYLIARSLAIMAGCITQPFEVVSRRMQLTASSATRRYRNVFDCACTVVAEEGYSALWAGLRARLLVTCLGMAVVELRRLV